MATSETTRPARASIDWVGSLAHTPLAEVVRRIASEERSGDLQINLGSAIKSIYFDRGFAVFAASNLKRDRLGESLIEAGRISRREFALASMLMKNTRGKFGAALVQAGVMSEEELGRQVAGHVNRIILSLFKAKDGIYSFDERGTSIPVELMVSLSVYRMMLDGVRYMTDGKLILAGLPPLSSLVRVNQEPPFTVIPRKLKAAEQTILRSTRQGARLSSLVQHPDLERGIALRACYGLWAAGLLVDVDGAKNRQPLRIQEETGVFRLSEIQQKFARIRAQSARQEILMEFDRIDRVTEEEILGLDSGPEESIDEAFETKKTEWEKKKNLVEAERSLVMKVDEIQERLQRAYERVREEARAKAEAPPAVESAEEGKTASEAMVSVDEDFASNVDADGEELLEVPTEQTLPPLTEEFMEEVRVVDVGIDIDSESTIPVAPAKPTETLAGDVPIEDPTTDPELDTEASLSTDAADEETPVQVVDATERPQVEADDEATGEPKRELYGAAKQERIRQLLRDVKLHFQVHDWEHAVSLLFELVDLAPDEASHHGMLARAMARHPVMRKDAERHFIDALRLAPQDADLHYSLGLYYKSFGLASRAENEFRTTLRINPRHEGARKHMGGGGKSKDPLRDMFRKIFG